MTQYPDLVLRHIDTAEFNKDFAARQSLLPRLRRIKTIEARIDDTLLWLSGVSFIAPQLVITKV